MREGVKGVRVWDGSDGRVAYFVLDCLVAPNGGHVLRHFGRCEGGVVPVDGVQSWGRLEGEVDRAARDIPLPRR
jgi:hypothetical protein